MDHRRLVVSLRLYLTGKLGFPRGIVHGRAQGAWIRGCKYGWQRTCASEDPARAVAREVVERTGEDLGDAELEGEVDGEDGMGVCVAGCVAAGGVRRCGLASVPLCKRSRPVVDESCETLDAEVFDKVFRGETEDAGKR